MANKPRGAERVRVEPFMAWLNERYEAYEQEQLAHQRPGQNVLGAARRVCEDVGWSANEGAIRRLYRYRRGILETKRGRSEGQPGTHTTVAADGFRRDVVEDALHSAGADFYEMYPEFAHERDGAPEPEGWCPSCSEHVLVKAGKCVWCDWKLTVGHAKSPGLPLLPLGSGSAAFEQAVKMRAAGLSYPAIVQVMGIYHGRWYTQDYWRRGCRALGVPAIKTGFAKDAA